MGPLIKFLDKIGRLAQRAGPYIDRGRRFLTERWNDASRLTKQHSWKVERNLQRRAEKGDDLAPKLKKIEQAAGWLAPVLTMMGENERDRAIAHVHTGKFVELLWTSNKSRSQGPEDLRSELLAPPEGWELEILDDPRFGGGGIVADQLPGDLRDLGSASGRMTAQTWLLGDTLEHDLAPALSGSRRLHHARRISHSARWIWGMTTCDGSRTLRWRA